MLQIYVPKLTNRLGYTINVLFKHILQADFEITTDKDTFQCHEGAKFCYGPQRIGDAPWVKNVELLFKTIIEDQEIQCFKHRGNCAFFQVKGQNLDKPFDILAASFYLISRYEEYLPHRSDIHKRFLAEDSLAYNHNFLEIPLVEIWALEIAEMIENTYPDYHFHRRHFSTKITIDIDAAFCYKNKGLFRSFTGSIRDAFFRHDMPEVKHRWRVLTNKERDPFNTFDYIIDKLGEHPGMKLIFFALLGDYDKFDKNITHLNPEFQELLKHLCDYSKLGIHASYASFENPKKLEIEIDRLSKIIHKPITRNRFHFLLLNLPASYKTLIANGITKDYSLGYANAVGFRASISSPFPFFDLTSNAETTLMLHPFSTMDTALMRHMHLSVDEAWKKTRTIMDACQAVGGCFCGIWHNENLSEIFGWQGWRKLFEQVLDYHEKLKVL